MCGPLSSGALLILLGVVLLVLVSTPRRFFTRLAYAGVGVDDAARQRHRSDAHGDIASPARRIGTRLPDGRRRAGTDRDTDGTMDARALNSKKTSKNAGFAWRVAPRVDHNRPP